MYRFLLIFFLFFTGCNVVNGTKTDSASVSSLANNDVYCVKVYTLGQVENALVKDNSGQIADFNSTTAEYCFNNPISYPVIVTKTSQTYIDVDYDNEKTANDLNASFSELKSYFNFVDYVTTFHALMVDNNLTQNVNATLSYVLSYYENNLKDKYNIDFNSSDLNERILNFVIYDYIVNGNSLNVTDDFSSKFNNLAIFFENYLNKSNISDKVKYYSFYHSLELLDKHFVNRVDTIHKPEITYLNRNNSPVSNYLLDESNLSIANDLLVNNNDVFAANLKDGVSKYDLNLNFLENEKINQTFSTSYRLYKDNNGSKECLFLADGNYGVGVFDISNGSFIYKTSFLNYINAKKGDVVKFTLDKDKNIAVDNVISINGYVSPYGKVRLLSFSTQNNGVYLINLIKVLDGCEVKNDIIYDVDDDENNSLLIAGEGSGAYSSAFSSDGMRLYVSKGSLIREYFLDSYDPTIISNSKKDFATANTVYNLKMISDSTGQDELFVTTNKGVSVFDVLNNGDLSLVSTYMTEGAEDGYIPKIKFISDKRILLFTDGYKGIKAIKYDESYNPMLCGVAYFAPLSDSSKLARIVSVDFYRDNGEDKVLIGVDGLGIVKFNLKDLLFKHCIDD